MPKSDYAPKDTGKGAAPEDYPTVAQDQGQAEGSGQQAPDALTQVERAALVKFPDGTPATMPWNRGVSPDPTKGNLGDEGLSAQILAQAKPDLSDETPIPGFVTTSKNAIVNPAAGVVPPTTTYPTIAEDQGAPGTPPKVERAQPVTAVKGGQGFFGGDLSQGPPGTKPDGTENEPYWPKTDKDVALLPPGANYIDPKDQSQKVTPGTPPALASTQLPNAPVAQTSPTPLPNAPVAQTSPTQAFPMPR